MYIQSSDYFSRWLINDFAKEVFIVANKNDLRFIKTEKLIEETYLSLKMNTHAQIKVSELCAAALINKTTFYLHYETIGHLHECVCRRKIEVMLSECPNVDNAFTDNGSFVNSLVKVLDDHSDMIHNLFGDDELHLLNLIEDCLLKRYLKGDEAPEQEMKIIFAVGGAARLLITGQSKDRIEMTVKLIGRIFDLS